jgi:hypothetical protein
MTTIDLRISAADWIRLRRQASSSFRTPRASETGAIAAVGLNQRAGGPEFLVAKMFWPEGGDLKVASSGELVLDSSYLRRAHLYMRKHGLAGLAVFHTHPMARDTVSFSRYDDQQEPRLVENLRELEPTTTLVSLVLGRHCQRGRVWSDAGASRPLSRLLVVGDELAALSLRGEPEPAPPKAGAIFDRGLPLTGVGALARLAGMTVAIVGASGTGSLVAELLVRAGCGKLLLVDDDVVKMENLNRILYATVADVHEATPKVDLLHRSLTRLGLPTIVEPVRGNVLDRGTLARLKDADLVFGCVDRALPRRLLCEFSARHLRPYIDVGTEIGANAEGIVSMTARTNYVAPGRPCLVCTGLVTPRQLHYETLVPSERARVAGLGYSDDLALAQPAVMELNMRAASMGVTLLRHLLQPFLLTPLPITISENLATYSMLSIEKPRVDDAGCTLCRANPHAGWGDAGPQLGLDPLVYQAIKGE